jgi:hypothetical protein
MNTSPRQHIDPSAHQRINTSVHQHSVINASTQSSTHQHNH